jgi:hypothetical protein
MQKITVTVPDNIHISIIADALAQLDSGITCKPVIKRARITPSESDSTPEYVGQSDLEYRRYCPQDTEGAIYCPQSEKWYLPEVMDGVSVQKAINKIMSEVNRRAHPHASVDFKRLAKHVPDEYVAADYMARFCDTLHHVKAEYTNGVTA